MSTRKTTSEIITQFIDTHQYRYDYSLVEYKNALIKVKIICKEHGIFEQNPWNHKRGQNCPRCKVGKWSTKDIIKQFKAVHGSLYDYSLVEYVDSITKVKIICKKHGVFEQKTYGHNSGKGCEKCSYERNIFSLDKVLSQFKAVHGSLYDYSLVEYVDSITKVKIICKEHGVFEQKPSHHKRGQGCIHCKEDNRYDNKPTYLYYIRIGTQYKIGVTLKSKFNSYTKAINHRFKSEFRKGVDIDIINCELFEDGAEAYKREQLIIANNKKLLIDKKDMILDSGHTETFKTDISAIVI